MLNIHHKNIFKALSLVALLLTLTLTWSTSSAQDLRRDPALVKGPDACGECHDKSVDSWKESHHAKTFKDLPRSKEGREIAKKMGLKRIKSGGDCLTCHFTSALEEGEPKPIAGITCESCHGAGADWIDVHSEFGGKDVTAENEDPAHKEERYAKSVAAGMIRPNDLYAVAENCYTCHTVPNEELVNTGGHAAGSAFELVAWSQGEVRHNLWYSEGNNEAPIERRRMMFVVGKLLDLEYAYRGLAEATAKAPYAIKMAKRAKAATGSLKKVAAAVDSAEINAVVELASKIKLKLNNKDGYTKAAAAVSEQAKKVAAMDGSAFTGVDALLPAAADYKGTPSS